MPVEHNTGLNAGITGAAADKTVLTVDEVAEITGKHVATIRGYINAGAFVARKVGRSYEVDRVSFEQWLGRALMPTRTPPQSGGVYDPSWGVFTRDPFGSS